MTTPPGTSLEMLHAVGELLAAEGPVEIGTMFRSPGLRTGTKIFAFLGHGDYLIVKLPRSRANELTSEGSAKPVTMGTRTLREWVEIPAHTSPDTTLDTWTALASEALHYVRSLDS
ncbi:TfoX/Sxy family protein [Arthrobacter sp. H35-D1]|uniref:TfoX/Sxy family protein n=1 Tax=Arthrobacter sp. H35-D1 TaxID=3046202 RepID=UPI0024B9ED85|nr:TfoX/Sxy family protein [Arthrobacter sp. H35-D1]MDJ0312645.1 TfoX/Sxy family protein [Arthrobacter sp. H35-D1]